MYQWDKQLVRETWSLPHFINDSETFTFLYIINSHWYRMTVCYSIFSSLTCEIITYIEQWRGPLSKQEIVYLPTLI